MRRPIVSQLISLDGVTRAPGGADGSHEPTPYPSGVVDLRSARAR